MLAIYSVLFLMYMGLATA